MIAQMKFQIGLMPKVKETIYLTILACISTVDSPGLRSVKFSVKSRYK